MIFISHRGNLKGREVGAENTIAYIQAAIDKGFEVEVDVRYLDGKFYLGHDGAQEVVDLDFLENTRLWVHAKNVAAFETLLHERVNVFWHDKDAYAITSAGYLWTHPGVTPLERSVYVMPELMVYSELIEDDVFAHLVECLVRPSFALCSDHVLTLRKHWGETPFNG